MEYLSKSARRVLNVFRATSPTFQGKRFYVVREMQFPQDMDFYEVEACLQRLEDAGLIKSYGAGAYRLTEVGLHWPEYSVQEKVDVFLKSILCPITVTIATELVLHGMPVMLRVLQALATGNP